MKERIQQELREIEAKHDIKLIYACESGSRAWGFPSPNSDYDVRFIYVRPMSYYLQVNVEHQRDVIDHKLNDILDITGWDLRKALGLLYKSNPTLLEWLHSPIVYYSSEDYHALKALALDYFSAKSCFYHYANMATQNYRDFLQKELVPAKKYFYVLRPVLAMQWLALGKGVAPVEFAVLLQNILADESVLRDVRDLLERKKHLSELGQVARIESLHTYLEAHLKPSPVFKDISTKEKATHAQKPEAKSFDAINQFFLDCLYKEL